MAIRRLPVLLVFLLMAGCVSVGTTKIAAEHFSLDAISRDDPEISYGSIIFERISEGDVSRRVIGWKDRAT